MMCFNWNLVLRHSFTFVYVQVYLYMAACEEIEVKTAKDTQPKGIHFSIISIVQSESREMRIELVAISIKF